MMILLSQGYCGLNEIFWVESLLWGKLQDYYILTKLPQVHYRHTCVCDVPHTFTLRRQLFSPTWTQSPLENILALTHTCISASFPSHHLPGLRLFLSLPVSASGSFCSGHCRSHQPWIPATQKMGGHESQCHSRELKQSVCHHYLTLNF